MRASPLGKIMISFSVCFSLAAVLFNSISWMFVALVTTSLFIYGRLRLVTEIEELDVEVKREILEKVIFAGEKATFKIEILNRGNSTIRGEIEDRLPAEFAIAGGENVISVDIAPKSIFKFTYSAISEKRGEYVIKGPRIKLIDSLGLNQEVVNFDCKNIVNVHTEKESLDAARKISGREHLRFSGFTKNPEVILKEFEFDGIREFVTGDKARDILWKALPKTGELLTKIYRKEGTLRTFIMLDCSRSMRLSANGISMVDHGIDISLQLSRVLLGSLQPTGITLFDEISIIDELLPETGRHQFENIITILKKAPSSLEQSTTVSERKIVETGPVKKVEKQDEEDSRQFFDALGELSDTGIMSAKGTGLENRIKKHITRNTGSKLLFILITDMLSSRDSILSAARISQRTNNAMILLQTFPDWYSGINSDLVEIESEMLYASLKGSIEIEAKLRKLGAYYLRIGPADNTSRIVKTIRRGT